MGSRATLRLYGEAIVRVDPLDEAAAIQLLLERARMASGDPAWGDSPEILADLARRLDGLPLAIELAAERAPVLSPSAMVGALGDRLPLLRTKRRDATGRGRSLLTCLEASWTSLPERERAALRALAVFSGSFSLEAVHAVLASEDALDLLDELVDRSLVQRLPGSPPRFALLGCVRDVTLSGRDGAGDEVEGRHAAFFFGLAARERTPSGLAPDVENVLAAHARRLSTDPVSPVRALVDIEPVLAQTRPLPAVAALLERATFHVTTPALEVKLLVAHARVLLRMGRAEAAGPKLLAARELAAAEGDPALVSLVRAAEERTSAPPSADRKLRPDASTEIFDAVTVTGATDPGALETARRACERSLVSVRRQGSRRSEGVVLTRLASVLLRAGELEDALSRADEAWAIHHELGAAAFEGVSAYVAGMAEVRLGRSAPAAERFAEVRARAEEIDSPLLRGYAHHGDGVLAEAVGDLGLAISDLASAAADLAKGGDWEPARPSEAAPHGTCLRVAPTWFELQGHPAVDLSRRRALRLLLRGLAEHAVARPGVALPLANVIESLGSAAVLRCAADLSMNPRQRAETIRELDELRAVLAGLVDALRPGRKG